MFEKGIDPGCPFETLLNKLQIRMLNLFRSAKFRDKWRGCKSDFLDQNPEFYDIALAVILIENGFKFHEVATVLRKYHYEKGETGSIKYFYKIFEQANVCIAELKSERRREAITRRQVSLRKINWLTKLYASLAKQFFFFKRSFPYGKKLGSVTNESR